MKNNILNISVPKPSSTAKLRVLTSYKNKIAIAQGTGIVVIPVADILYCQAQSNYCKIVLKAGKEYLISKTLKRVQEVLNPDDFIKVHQSYVVAMDAITAFKERLTLANKHTIPVSRAHRKLLTEGIGKRCAMV